ncbi:MAG: ferredoxin--NADP reductase [Acidobacteria bacterium]|nr:ferredoxin--NADP reductase [Acidobacteriota bacterium]
MVSNYDNFLPVEIVSRRDLAPDLWTIRVHPSEPLRFKPGQYATLGVREGVELIERPYSIVSSPLEDEVEFFFELVPGSGLTPKLHRKKVGETLWMSREAGGLFALDEESGRKRHFFAATVTGIAPFISMVRSLALEGRRDHSLWVLHGASRSWELAYCDELEKLTSRSEWFRYIPTISRPHEDSTWKGEVGRVEDVLRKHLDANGLDPATTTAYLCGHPEMIATSRRILERGGFRNDAIRQEVYWVPDEESE